MLAYGDALLTQPRMVVRRRSLRDRGNGDGCRTPWTAHPRSYNITTAEQPVKARSEAWRLLKQGNGVPSPLASI